MTDALRRLPLTGNDSIGSYMAKKNEVVNDNDDGDDDDDDDDISDDDDDDGGHQVPAAHVAIDVDASAPPPVATVDAVVVAIDASSINNAAVTEPRRRPTRSVRFADDSH